MIAQGSSASPAALHTGVHPVALHAGVDKVRVLLVDDHAHVRMGTARLIAAEPDLEICGEAAGAEAALRIVEAARPDLAIIDLTLEQGSGLDLVREIKRSFPSVLMIVCSMHDEALYALRTLRAGAHGYVNKLQAPNWLLVAIRKVLAGGLYLSQPMTQRIVERATGLTGESAAMPQQALSDRELQVYELIGEALSVNAIGEMLHISPKTVEFHRERIRDKLGIATNAELSRHAVAWVLDLSQKARATFDPPSANID